MPSSVSREDVEDQCWKSGIRSRYIMNQLLRTIDLYALNIARKYAPAEEPEEDPYADLLPGQWDKHGEVTRCRNCSEVKSWHPCFHLDRGHASGYRTVCKVCLSKKASGMARATLQAGGWKCPACGERKESKFFPQEKRDNPRRPLPCSDCAGE